ncbi:MAG TPA: mechanosensitive ion channel [Candidatus Competibacteraceae bacterium]|nr:mechanosensitive ion channel [Candidatus Competibacteraceae bacterium]HQD57816.1 mechanosensitive ion channel [Candidatus Competibacteraceae bacterium]
MTSFVSFRHRLGRWWIGSILLLICAGPIAGLAQDTLTLLAPSDPLKAAERQNATRQTLAAQRQSIDQLRQDIAQLNAEQPVKLSALASESVSATQVEQARLDSDAIRLKQEELQTGIEVAKRQIKTLRQAIPSLEAQEQLLKNPAKDGPVIGNRAEQLAQLRMTLEQRRTDLQLEQDSLKNLEEWLALLDQRRVLANQWRAQMEELHLQQQAQQRQEAQQDYATRLEGEQQKQLSKAEELRSRLQRQGEKLSMAQRTLLETEIQSSEARAKLLRWDIRQAAIGDELANWEGLIDAKDADPRRLQEGIRRLTALRGELREASSVLDDHLERLAQRQAESAAWKADSAADSSNYRRGREILAAMAEELRQRQDTVRTQSERLERLRERLEATYLQRANQDLLAREPALSAIPGQWSATLTELGNTPRVLAHQLWLSVESALKAAAQASLEQWLILIGAGVSLAGLAALGRRYLARIAKHHADGQDDSFAAKFTYTLARLLRKNLWGIALAVMLALALWEWRVPQPGLGILLTLVLLWIGIKTPLNLAWLLLVAPDVPTANRNLRLYLLLSWMMLVGGALGALVILSHLSKLPQPAIRILDQTLMLYWLAVCHPLLHIRRLLLGALAERYAGQLWLSAIRLLTLLLPLALAGAALLGLAGYLNLAWLVVQRLLALSGILLIWLLARGLTNDLIVFLKNVAITRSNYGLLWTQEILAPLNQTLQWLLFLISLLLLLDIYSEQGYTFAFWATVPWEPVLFAMVLALLCYEGLLLLGGYLVEQSRSAFGGAVIRHLRQPLGLLAPATTAQLLLPSLELSPTLADPIYHALTLLDIAAIGWLLVRLTSVAEDVMRQHYLFDAKDNLGARRIQTQFQMLRRIVVITVQLLALAVMMMTFPKIRELGAGLLASAGVAGLVIGVAARPFLENLIAGVQIGLTQPIRIDDVVIVEGEWGRIAEINATHVVVRLWDDRRLIVPLNYFNTKPFQNWTWAGSELMGTAFFYVDYTFPVEAGREALKRILDDTEKWDGRAWGLQVTDTTDRIMTLRALMSAPDAPTAWDLRCLVREHFVAFLQREYPQCLPRTRFSESQDPETQPPPTLSPSPEALAHGSASSPRGQGPMT